MTTTQTQQPSTPLIFVRTRIREVQQEYMRWSPSLFCLTHICPEMVLTARSDKLQNIISNMHHWVSFGQTFKPTARSWLYLGRRIRSQPNSWNWGICSHSKKHHPPPFICIYEGGNERQICISLELFCRLSPPSHTHIPREGASNLILGRPDR